jgi:hypothetical protein
MSQSVSIYSVSGTQSVTWTALTVATFTEFTTRVPTWVTVDSSIMPSYSEIETVILTAGLVVYSTISFQHIDISIYYTALVNVPIFYAVATTAQPSKGVSNGILIGTTTGGAVVIVGIIIAIITVVRSKYKASSSEMESEMEPHSMSATQATTNSLSGSDDGSDLDIDKEGEHRRGYELETLDDIDAPDGLVSADIYV